jgi:NAD(P)-dependent dehydrogenase (short-subunit alcohol dehydrogenase family)
VFAAELQDTGVRFLSIDPGDMDTEMHAAAIPDANPSTLQKPEEAARRIIEIIRHAGEFPSGLRLQAALMEAP